MPGWLRLASDSDVIRMDADPKAAASALHFYPETLERATRRLRPQPDSATVLLINYRVGGIGSNSCRPGQAKRTSCERPRCIMHFAYRLFRGEARG